MYVIRIQDLKRKCILGGQRRYGNNHWSEQASCPLCKNENKEKKNFMLLLSLLSYSLFNQTSLPRVVPPSPLPAGPATLLQRLPSLLVNVYSVQLSSPKSFLLVRTNIIVSLSLLQSYKASTTLAVTQVISFRILPLLPFPSPTSVSAFLLHPILFIMLPSSTRSHYCMLWLTLVSTWKHFPLF